MGTPKERKAQLNYTRALIYYVGKGVVQDYAKAIEFFLVAAEHDHEGAKYELAEMYKYGLGVSINYEKAFKWYRSAAEQGHSEAQAELGSMYEYGMGTDSNDAESVKWYLAAAKQGNSGANFHLGRHCQFKTHKYVDAIQYYRSAALGGHAEAAASLFWMFYFGHGMKSPSYLHALRWAGVAVDNGSEQGSRLKEMAQEKLEKISLENDILREKRKNIMKKLDIK